MAPDGGRPLLADDEAVLEGGDRAVSLGTTVDTSALGCQEGSAMIARPPAECSAPTTKSVCPPNPE